MSETKFDLNDRVEIIKSTSESGALGKKGILVEEISEDDSLYIHFNFKWRVQIESDGPGYKTPRAYAEDELKKINHE